MPSNHLVLCHPLLPPSIFPSIRVFSKESVLRIRWPKYWSFSFSISPSNEYSGLISFRIDWFDLLAVQGTLKSLLQHHSSKTSILRCSAFFKVQPLHPYMTTGKTIALTRRTFVGKVMSLFFNMLLVGHRLVIAILTKESRKWTFGGANVIVSTPHQGRAILHQKIGRWLTDSRILKYEGILLERHELVLTTDSCLDPAEFLTRDETWGLWNITA